ncbi:MAG: glycyl-radical enzyme activating protein [Dehalobacterium sp.]|jgi:pyruvate formate lyase activating enzyme
MEGLIFKIDRGSTHDGPGMRVVVYLKGCPLHCNWCSTPQSQKFMPEIMHMGNRCVLCGKCLNHCPERAISLTEEGLTIDRLCCTNCGICADVCLHGGMQLAGTLMEMEEVYNVVARYGSFFLRTGGGVTISGGEPLFQYEFTKALLKRCRKGYINTNLETSGYIEHSKFEDILRYLNYICIDLKHMNPCVHKEITGVSNEIILENIRCASERVNLFIRYPMIPGKNDSDENVVATAKFIANLGSKFNRLDLLPYHNLGTVNYVRLGREYLLPMELEPLPKSRMQEIRDIFLDYGVNTVIA